MARNSFDEYDAKKRIEAQMPLSEKCDKSHFVIDNSATRNETRIQTEKILSYIRQSNHDLWIKFSVLTVGLFILSFILLIGYFILR